MISRGYSITLLHTQIEELEKISIKEKRSKNYLIREAVKEYLERKREEVKK